MPFTWPFQHPLYDKYCARHGDYRHVSHTDPEVKDEGKKDRCAMPGERVSQERLQSGMNLDQNAKGVKVFQRR